MNDIVNNKMGHNIVNDSSAHKPGGLLVTIDNSVSTRPRKPGKIMEFCQSGKVGTLNLFITIA